MTAESIHEMCSLSDEELLILIGKAASPQGLSVRFRPPAYWLRMGRRWFDAKLESLGETICSNSRLRALFAESTGIDDLTVIAALADVLSQSAIGFAPYAVAILLLRRGLKDLCPEWGNHR